MKTTASLVAITALALSGCAHKVWINTSVTNEQAHKDFNECQYDAVKYGNVNMYESSMTSAIQSGIKTGLRENELMTTCMTSKGYRLTTQEQGKTNSAPSSSIKSEKTQAEKTQAEIAACLKKINETSQAYLAKYAEDEEFRRVQSEGLEIKMAECYK